MIPVHVFKVSGTEASAIKIDTEIRSVLAKYPDYVYDFTVYGWDVASLEKFPPYIKPLIFIDEDAFPYTTKLVDVLYSIFPTPDNASKVAVYRRPVRNTVPIYFYKTSDGVKVSLEELPLEPAMDLVRVFMPVKPYSLFIGDSQTCVPVDEDFTDAMSFSDCLKNTTVPRTTNSPTSTMAVKPSNEEGKQSTCWYAVFIGCLLLVMLITILLVLLLR